MIAHDDASAWILVRARRSARGSNEIDVGHPPLSIIGDRICALVPPGGDARSADLESFGPVPAMRTLHAPSHLHGAVAVN
jgi:hypothetical protein